MKHIDINMMTNPNYAIDMLTDSRLQLDMGFVMTRIAIPLHHGYCKGETDYNDIPIGYWGGINMIREESYLRAVYDPDDSDTEEYNGTIHGIYIDNSSIGVTGGGGPT